MIALEVVRTCANPHVARAAVASIGGAFALNVENAAARCDLSSGLYAARLVRAFARDADEQDWEGLDGATRGVETPILSGLQFVLERSLGRRFEARGEGAPPAWAIAAACGDGARSD